MMMIIAPHPDDDILCCAGIIHKNHENTKIIFVTDGSKGSPNPEERGPKLALKRMSEAYNALHRLGVKDDNIVFLNNEDGNVKKYRDNVYNQLSKLLLQTDINAIYFPSPFDIHPDHSEIGNIVLSIIHRKSRTTASYKLKGLDLFMYTIHKPDISNIFNLANLKSLLLELKIKLSFKYICFKVNDIELKKQALEEHKSQISYMQEKVKKLASNSYECFYFKHI